VKSWLNFAACVTVATAAFSTPSALASDQEALPQAAAPDSAVCLSDEGGAARFRAGDRITLTEYERIDPDPGDRTPTKDAYPSYRLRAEVSGDFDVAEDGTISVPILGQFKAAGRSVEELRDAIGGAFESILGHVGLITIAIAEHQPIYVDGVIKNPGAYKYTPGLTVRHAVSVAGGFENVKFESHQILMETMQEAGTGEQAKNTLERLLARDAVLHAELASTPVSTPQVLGDLAGESGAKELIAAQISERQTVLETNAVLQKQQAELIDNANQILDARTSQVKLVDAAIEQRGGRLQALKSLMAKGAVGEPVYQSALAEYLDTLARKQDAIAAIQQTRGQLSDAQAILAKLKLDARFVLQHEISDLELQIGLQSIIYRSHVATINLIEADPNGTPGAPPLAYDLVRRMGGRVATYRVEGNCLLQPGDLVRAYIESGKEPQYVARNPPERQQPENRDGKMSERVDARASGRDD
jgi:exopolysaccharide production protein ExoF